MPTLSVANYLGLLKRSGLLPEDKLRLALAEFMKATGIPAEEAPAIQLAKFLIQKELITPWQNEYLFQGKHKGFFLGKYKLMKLLGTGGMGAVFLAEHMLMCRRVAIKVLPTSRVKDQKKLKQFLDEARAIASLDHPNIIQAYNVDSQDSLYYLVMEYVEGSDLEQVVRKQGPLSYENAVEYLRQAADGLAHAHGRKMVHRDIKPSNLLLDKQGTIKILDLGLALLTGGSGDGPADSSDETSAAWSVGMNVAGTMDYLAPEQAMGCEPDARGDLYSLGCTLYFLLIGAPPFPSKTMHELLLKHQTQEPEPLTELRPDIPPGLVQICAKLMAKNPADRYASAGALALDLDEWLEENGVATRDTKRPRATTVMSRPKIPAKDRELQVDNAPTWTSKDNEETTEIFPVARKSGLPAAWLAGGFVGLLLLAVGGWMLMGRSSNVRGDGVEAARHQDDSKRRRFVDENVKWNDAPRPEPKPARQSVAPPAQPPKLVFKPGAGKFGAGLVCDGRIYPKFPHDQKWEPEQFTAEAWVWLDELPQANEPRRWLVSKNPNEHHEGHYGLMLFGDKVGGIMNIGGGPDNVLQVHSDQPLFQPKRWQHLAMTFDGREMKAFYQGDQVAARVIDKKRNAGVGELSIGRRVDDYVPIQGMMDEVRIYNRPLSAEELKTHAEQSRTDARPAKIDEGLVGYWGFEEPQKAGAYAPPKTAIYRIFEDEPDFLTRLTEGGAPVAFETDEKQTGRGSCRVGPDQRHFQKFDGLNLPIREHPQLGEYRFLRFAWKKRGGTGIYLQMANDGTWGHRYHAGSGSTTFRPSTEIAAEIPMEWTVVTRDLFADFGAFQLTGLALSPTDGECGFFDGIYAARSIEDFDGIDARLIAGEGDWSQAPLVLTCGRKDGDVLRQDDGYGVELLQVSKHDGWAPKFPRSYCWYHDPELKFKLQIPEGTTGTLRMLFVDGNGSERRQRIVVEGREIADIEAFGAGVTVAVPIRSADTADGTIEVTVIKQGALNAAVSVVEFLPAK